MLTRTLVVALLLSGCSRGPADCTYDVDVMMALDYRAFDQDVPWGGWRGVARDDRCSSDAADLIAMWRDEHADGTTPGQLSILNWHEGQLRASAGQNERAATLLTSAKRTEPQDAYDHAWNLYADATVAFLRRDRPALDAAYEAMMALDEPEDWEEFAAEGERVIGRRPRWPQNVEFVERFRNCFDAPYAEAYGGGCD